MKKIFVSYGNHRYEQSSLRIKAEAAATDWFDDVRVFSPGDLTAQFREDFAAVLSQPRGAGYWLWKLDLLEQAFCQCVNGDLVVYCDAGCSINPLASARFQVYVDRLAASDHGMISFQMGHCEEHYTTQECFDALGVPVGSDIRSSGQFAATVIIAKVCEQASAILREFRGLIQRDPLVITDHYNSHQLQCFIDHRHDQSIFSILRKQIGSLVIPDETYFQSFGCQESLEIPFWATRIQG